MAMKENDEVKVECLQVEMNGCEEMEKQVKMVEWQWMGDPLPRKEEEEWLPLEWTEEDQGWCLGGTA